MHIHNIEQGTDEWHKLRYGRLTASDFHTFMGSSSTRTNLIWKKAAERLTQVASDSCRFSNVHTDRGHENEPVAREMYEIISTNDVQEVGFVTGHNAIGCSPDGIVGDDGLIEIKCKDTHTHLKAVVKNYIDPTHVTQIQFSLYVTGRKWCDYILYNEHYPQPLHIIHVLRDEEYIGKIKEQIERANTEINKIIDSAPKELRDNLNQLIGE